MDEPRSESSQLRRLTSELAEFRTRYQALVEQIPAVLYVNVCDEDETTVYVSPQTSTILGISVEDWYAGRWTEFLHPEDRQRVEDAYGEFVRSAREGVDEYRFIRPDGRMLWVHDRVTVIRDEAGAPVLVQGVIFDVTEQKRAHDLLAKIDAISREFTELVLRGAGLKQLLETLAGIVANPVMLENTAHQLVAFARHARPVEEILADWVAHSRHGHEPSSGVVTEPDCVWISVRLRDQEWGRIHVLGVDSEIDRAACLALDRAAAAVGLTLLAERDAAHLADNARAGLIADIWQGRYRSVQEVLARARGLGAQLTGRTLVAVVVDVPEPVAAGEGRHQVRAGVLTALRAAVEAAAADGLSALVGDRVLGIVSVPRGATKRLAQVWDLALATMTTALPDLPVAIGVSRPAAPDTLRTALTEASEAAAYGLRVGRGPAIYHFDDLGVRQLLARLSDGPELSRFVETELGPLLKHDTSRATPLVDTLRTLLESTGGKAEAARALHIDRRSMYYRIGKIERLIGRDIEDPDTRLRLQLALQGLDLLRQRAVIPPDG